MLSVPNKNKLFLPFKENIYEDIWYKIYDQTLLIGPN